MNYYLADRGGKQRREKQLETLINILLANKYELSLFGNYSSKLDPGSYFYECIIYKTAWPE